MINMLHFWTEIKLKINSADHAPAVMDMRDFWRQIRKISIEWNMEED